MNLLFEPILPVPVLVLTAVLIVTCAILEARKAKHAGNVEIGFGICAAFLIAGSILTAGSRPYIVVEHQTEQGSIRDMDIVFVVDDTLSMWAEDEDGGASSRIEAVGDDIEKIMEAAPGCSASVVMFDNQARQLVPFTADIDSVVDAVVGMPQIDDYSAKGTDFTEPALALRQVLVEREAEYVERPTLLFYMSDGETEQSIPYDRYAALASHITGGCVIGYGTEEGGKIPVSHQDGSYVIDYETGGPAITKYDPNSLTELSEALEIAYGTHGDGKTIDWSCEVAKTVWDEAPSSTRKLKAAGNAEGYFVLCIPLALGLLIWLSIAAYHRSIASKRANESFGGGKQAGGSDSGRNRRG